MKNILSDIISSKAKTPVSPREFFIAWSGVPTLAYKGFSPVLLELKKEISRKTPDLKPENAGSIWPKTTFGALRDNRKLSLQDTKILRNICGRVKLDQNDILEIDQLQIVIFQCRSLEKRLLTFPVKMKSALGNVDNDPPEYHLKQIDEIMHQFSRDSLAAYWKDLMHEGHRENHYRTTHIEPTLVYDIPDEHPIHNSIDNFTDEVDKQFPNIFCWFNRDSWHMTIRRLV